MHTCVRVCVIEVCEFGMVTNRLRKFEKIYNFATLGGKDALIRF